MPLPLPYLFPPWSTRAEKKRREWAAGAAFSIPARRWRSGGPPPPASGSAPGRRGSGLWGRRRCGRRGRGRSRRVGRRRRRGAGEAEMGWSPHDGAARRRRRRSDVVEERGGRGRAGWPRCSSSRRRISTGSAGIDRRRGNPARSRGSDGAAASCWPSPPARSCTGQRRRRRREGQHGAVRTGESAWKGRRGSRRDRISTGGRSFCCSATRRRGGSEGSAR